MYLPLIPHGVPERGIPGDFCKMPRPGGLGMMLDQTEPALSGRDPSESWGPGERNPEGEAPTEVLTVPL